MVRNSRKQEKIYKITQTDTISITDVIVIIKMGT